RAACIAGVDKETMRVAPRTWTEGDADYFTELDMVVAEGAAGREAPGGRAYHERELAVSQNVSTDPDYEEWRADAAEQGFASLAVAPLEYGDEFHGLLAVFGDRPGIFDDSERDLLREVSDDVAYAMHAEQTRSELRETASRLEALYERSPDMINLHDSDGNVLNPNPRLCEKTGYDESTLTDMRVWDLDVTLDPDDVSRRWEQMDVGDTSKFTGEYERADGTSFPVEVHVRRLDLDGSDRFVVISRDVSDRRERKRELRRLEEIVENLPIGVFRSTAAGDLVDANPAFVSLFGGESPADFADVATVDLWVDATDRSAMLERLDREGVVQRECVEMETLDGERKWIETTIRLTGADGTQYLDGIVRDVTERRQRKQRLEQAETMFEHAQDALFLVDVGDEFTLERVNPVYEEASGFSNEDVQGKTQREILGEDAGATIEARYQKCVDRREPLEYEEVIPIDGEATYWETRIAPVVIDGTVEKLVGATRELGTRPEPDHEQ
ncbi:MAG: PAS domain S-box protein, partial [Halobacterium sp.]